MTLISTTIPNLVNGVSQQPYALRLASQAENQINAHSSVVDGLKKRPPSRVVRRISLTPFGNAYVHTINRDLNERYIVTVTSGNLRVFRLDGQEIGVNFPHGKTYLNSHAPDQMFRLMTVADYTFVLNKGMAVQRSASSRTPTRRPEAIIWIKQGAYGIPYTLNVGGVVSAYNAPDGSNAAHTSQIGTEFIATKLREGLQRSPDFNAQFDIGQRSSTLYLWRKDGQEFGVQVSDGLGDTAIKLCKGAVQRFGDLPAKAVNGARLEVKGDQTSSFDNYYVEYVENPNVFEGVWKETAKMGEQDRLEPATMPHALVREANGTFTFKQLDWAPRKVGDLDSNPFPSFVGSPLSDMFFHRNRLGFVADENVVFSKSGDTFDFFRASATQLLDTDPIDVAVSHTKVSIIRHAIPFNESLLLFSDQTQFMLGATDLLTPQTISINQTTEFEASLLSRPVGAGRNVYFAVNKGWNSGVREYYLDGDTRTNDAADITSHVPKYLPGGITKLAASSNEDTLVAFSPRNPNELFVYKYYWQDSEKLQSSWSKWQFGGDVKILYMDFIESDLYLLLERNGEVLIEVINLESGRVDEGVDFQVHLDHRFSETGSSVIWDAANNETQFTIPYSIPGDGGTFRLIAWENANGRRIGQQIKFRKINDNVFRCAGRLTKFIFGREYVMRYQFSTLVIKEDAIGGGQMTVGEGRIQLRRMALTYNQSGYFRVEVTPFRRDTYRYVFSGRVVGSGNNIIGEPSVEEGKFRYPVLSRNDGVKIEIVNDSHMPCAFLSAEWEAMYNIRSKRL